MDAWWFRVAYIALFVIFFFVFRYFFNRWRRQALAEQLALHNLQLANQTIEMESGRRARQRNVYIIDDSPPPEFEVAVKYAAPVDYTDNDMPPPGYEDALKNMTVEQSKETGQENSESAQTSRSDSIPNTSGQNIEIHI